MGGKSSKKEPIVKRGTYHDCEKHTVFEQEAIKKKHSEDKNLLLEITNVIEE